MQHTSCKDNINIYFMHLKLIQYHQNETQRIR
jgi:hypothetical protein